MKKLFLTAKLEIIAIINILMISAEFLNGFAIMAIAQIIVSIYAFNKFVK